MKWINVKDVLPAIVERKEDPIEVGCYTEYSDFVLVYVDKKYYVMRLLIDYREDGTIEHEVWVDSDYALEVGKYDVVCWSEFEKVDDLDKKNRGLDNELYLPESVKKLKSEIENTFHVKYDFEGQNYTYLAKTLCDREVFSLSKDMKEIVYFLIMNCSDFNFESPYLASLICGSLEQVQAQKDAFIKFIDEKSITLGMFIRLTVESIKEYEIYFEGIPLEGQCEKLMQSILNWGDTAKSIADIEKGLKHLDLFDISEEEKWKFVCDNASVFFNDFSRGFDYLFVKLIEKYGKAVAFEKLKEHPEYLRWGMKCSML